MLQHCFKLLMLMAQHLDVDECVDQVDECDQNCHNNVGSYSCSCNLGFTLNRDESHCDGTANNNS